MSWKNVKEYYQIGHLVQIRDGKIMIGSAYVPELLSVSMEGFVSWGKLGPGQNEDLARYHAEMTADPMKLVELVTSPDTFVASLPVWTYSGSEIMEKQCEEYGWPNITHDGLMMYDNTFSLDRSKVIEWALKNSQAGVECMVRRVSEIGEELRQAEEALKRYESEVNALKSLSSPTP
jgi:hypothetical protein